MGEEAGRGGSKKKNNSNFNLSCGLGKKDRGGWWEGDRKRGWGGDEIEG